MFMDKRSVSEIIVSCVDKLYNKDKYLFDCKICERCLMFRFAYYLQIKFSNYYVDCEFNKMGFNNYKHETKVETIDQGKILKKCTLTSLFIKEIQIYKIILFAWR